MNDITENGVEFKAMSKTASDDIDKPVDFQVVNNSSDMSMEKRAFLESEKQKSYEITKFASVAEPRANLYPTSFLNLSDMEIPKTATEIFQWCKYFLMFDPIIAGAVNSLASFPVTEVYLEDSGENDSKKKSDKMIFYEKMLFKDINIYKNLIEIGIDYNAFGNCIVFGELMKNDKGRYTWKNIVRLDPTLVTIDYNPVTQEKTYKYNIPANVRQIVKKQSPKADYDNIPDIIKEAALKGKSVILNNKNIYHFSRPTDSIGSNAVWGPPLIANVLKLIMYRNILRQAQEAFAREHIVPRRIYYLESSKDYNINVDYGAVVDAFSAELRKMAADPNYKVVAPIPVNMLTLGGEGKALLLVPEIQQVQDEILAGMNVPREFIFGGVSYSGSAISLKILENNFITYRLLLDDYINNFLIGTVADANGDWDTEDSTAEMIVAKMVDLKMQDDVQQKQLILNLNASGKCTNEYLWKTMGFDPDKMKIALEKEALEAVALDKKVKMDQLKANFEISKQQIDFDMQLEVYRRGQMQKYGLNPPTIDPSQTDTQQEQSVEQPAKQPAEQSAEQVVEQPAEPNVPQPTANTAGKESGDEREIAGIALQVSKLPEKDRPKAIGNLPSSIQSKIMSKVQELDSAKAKTDSSKVDMRPMPEQKPPRRDTIK